MLVAKIVHSNVARMNGMKKKLNIINLRMTRRATRFNGEDDEPIDQE